ncbi:39S ribosomal protein L35, mitochondrial [Contarinia nasturtii]|uniref:39S ribosomal protein L35, mitochondrial n=1 Tax=Contarinia nasturtii TaxID=265458 RepID=UPI0012D44DBF|nr:39S ribosomal protein L35, mitochondrial [Contarinia nasturtii]
MFRVARSVLGRTNALVHHALSSTGALQSNVVRNVPNRGFTAFNAGLTKSLCAPDALKHLRCLPQQITPTALSAQLESVPVRTVCKHSIHKDKRKTVKAVIKRFYRLHWGGWIRTRCGRHKKMHKKKSNRKHRLRQHVLVNKTQAHLLDKMVTNFWKRPKYYIDDLYEPYHERTYYYAARKPMPKPEKPLTKPLSCWELSKANY